MLARAIRDGDDMSGRGSIWSVVTGSEPAERRALGLSFAFFFFVLTSYYLLRPLRDQFSAAVGSTNLWPFWTATLVATLVVTPFFGALVSRYPREKFIPAVYGFFILCLLAFVPAFRAQEQIGARELGIVFYVWVSVFNLFVVSLFWSFMADLFDSVASRRLFPVIALGGTVGSIVGPIIASLVPIEELLFSSMAMLAAAIACTFALARWSRDNPNPERRALEGAIIGGAWWAGLRSLFTSPFLRQMVALTMLSEAVGTIAYGLAADYIKANYLDAEARKTVYAQIDLATNSLIVLMQGAGITRFILSRYGVAVGLVVPSVFNLCVLLAVAVSGQPVAVIAMIVITRAGAYGLYKPASDAIYTRVPREVRYKGKNAIDTVVWRLGDVVVSGAMALAAPLAIGVTCYALVCAACSATSGWFGWRAPKAPDLEPEK
jgi:AAA family ATP:ADP antiporter